MHFCQGFVLDCFSFFCFGRMTAGIRQEQCAIKPSMILGFFPLCFFVFSSLPHSSSLSLVCRALEVLMRRTQGVQARWRGGDRWCPRYVGARTWLTKLRKRRQPCTLSLMANQANEPMDQIRRCGCGRQSCFSNTPAA